MQKKIFLFVAIIFFVTISKSQNIDYSVKLINAALLKNANAVKRFEETKLVIEDIGNATLYHKYAITILNEAGDKYADISEYYDKLRIIKNLDGNLFNADGVKIRSMKKSELQDVSLAGGNNFVDDDRIRHHNFNNKIYPYTIEYETTIAFKGIFHLPAWGPVDGEQMSVSLSKLIVEAPSEYKLRYKTFNLFTSPIINHTKKTDTYEWQIENLAAIEKNPLSQEWYELSPAIFLAPTDFFLEDYNGNMSTWNDLGKFIYSLNVDRNQLPLTIKDIVHKLTDSLPDIHNKIKALYKYLQSNTRYVSIQLGIGGWQTFPAEYVAKKGYGDCKALSNYMCSLLKEIGIKSYYSLINGGVENRKILVDFPSTQFNHIIVCVPLKSDTVWLECTSQTLPMGYLSGFTSNRYALLVDESGGKIVHTPKYTFDDNLQLRNISASINLDGNMSMDVNTNYVAMQQDQLHEVIAGSSKEKINEYLKDEISLSSFDIVNYSFKEELGTLPSIKEALKINARNYAQVSGKRLFITPNILTRTNMRLTPDTTRKNDIELEYEFCDVDTVAINFPEGYHIETLPKPILIENKFGKYTASSKIVDNKIIYYRSRKQFSGIFPASNYTELVKYYNDVYKADNATVVLIKNE